MVAGIDAGFFEHLATGRFGERLITFPAAGDRLPEAWVCSSLQEQDVEPRGMDDDENR